MIKWIINKMFSAGVQLRTLMLVHDGKLRITKKGKVKKNKNNE